MKKKLSIIDIAKHLNVSITAVSFILNGKAKEKRISDELVERVLKFVDEVGYKPNLLARGFRTGKTNIIGLLVEDISNPFFCSIAKNIEEAAYRNGYKILYSSTDNDTEKTKELIRVYRDRCVEGYIIAPPPGLEDDINDLIKSDFPVVLFDRSLEGVKSDYVGIDSAKSMYEGVKHLIEKGHKNIGFVTLDSLQSQMQDRFLGYDRAIQEYKLPEFIKEISFHQSPENIVKQIIYFLQRKKELDAVVFATNYLAVSGLKAITELGLSVPKDLAIMAFDDLDLFELYAPSITTVSQPVKRISEEVISLLMDRLNNASGGKKKKPFQNIVLETSLIIRNSTK
jgi:LacI family transcriptional regulator